MNREPNWIFLSARSAEELTDKVSALDINGELKTHYSLHSTSVAHRNEGLLVFFATFVRD